MLSTVETHDDPAFPGNCIKRMAEDAFECTPSIRAQCQDLHNLRADLVTAETEYAGDKVAAAQHNVLLMQEVHHRVKNSLQLVQSLLNLQAGRAVNDAAAQQLSESAARVRVIGAMHDRLYRTDGLLEVEVGPYLEGLVDDLRTGLSSTISGRRITLDAGPARWAGDDVLTLGLILTELVTNALKYGAGAVTVRFREEENRRVRLVVEDEGQLPQDFDPSHCTGFGMKMIHTLLEQRGGSLTVDPAASHTNFVATLPPSADGSN